MKTMEVLNILMTLRLAVLFCASATLLLGFDTPPACTNQRAYAAAQSTSWNTEGTAANDDEKDSIGMKRGSKKQSWETAAASAAAMSAGVVAEEAGAVQDDAAAPFCSRSSNRRRKWLTRLVIGLLVTSTNRFIFIRAVV